MRRIEKRSEPPELRQWRAAGQAAPASEGVNFGYAALRQSRSRASLLLESLLTEQGGLCAYTGRRVGNDSAHVEHLTPPCYCERGQDVAYDNMGACWPEPNGPAGDFGAHAKGNWPSPAEAGMFVSPLSPGCEGRFVFNDRGEIRPANAADRAAATTIGRLKLDHKRLTAFRRSEIDAVLGETRTLSLKDARRWLKGLGSAEAALNAGAQIELTPYCFALKQVLSRYIEVKERILKR